MVMLFIIVVIFAFGTPCAWAKKVVEYPLSGLRPEDIQRLSLEPRDIIRVQGRVAAVDYSLLRRDFPFLASKTNAELDVWLLETACYFRASHIEKAAEEGIHGPLEIVPGFTRIGWTSNVTQRAVYVEVRHPDTDEFWSYIDVKGSGTDHPRYSDVHANGVLRFDEAFLEFLMARLLRRMSEVLLPNDSFRSVQIYGVIHIPAFHRYSTMKGGMAHPSPRHDIALLLRQGFPRSPSIGGYLASAKQQVHLEYALYSFGLNGLSTAFDDNYGWSSQDPNDNDPTTGASRYLRSVFFFDHQLTENKYWIDFNLVRLPIFFLNPKNVYSKPVYMLGEFYGHCLDRKAVFNTSSDSLFLKTASQCKAFLDSRPLAWKYPRQPCHDKTYDLNIYGSYDFAVSWQYDFSVLFPIEQQQEIEELLRFSIPDGLTKRPSLAQEIFDHLDSKILKWPIASKPVHIRCQKEKPTGKKHRHQSLLDSFKESTNILS